MFGYVLPLTAELKVREWHAYRAYYCGLCKELKREYGFLSRFLLNYDLVLPALLADGMAGTQARMCPERCMANPVEKRPMCQSTAGLALAADALVLTVYYKLADDLADERFFKRLPALVLWPFLSRMRKKAAVRRPALDETLRGFQSILSGDMDAYPEAAFYNVGTIDEAVRKAEQLQKEASL